MKEVEESIDFLEYKARIIINTIQESKNSFSTLINNPGSGNLEEINQRQLQRISHNQVKVNILIEHLLEIARLKHISKDEGSGLLSEHFSQYQQSLVEKTVNSELNYDETHPYFGYPRFNKLLISYYTSIEDYEMCKKIKDVEIKDFH